MKELTQMISRERGSEDGNMRRTWTIKAASSWVGGRCAMYEVAHTWMNTRMRARDVDRRWRTQTHGCFEFKRHAG